RSAADNVTARRYSGRWQVRLPSRGSAGRFRDQDEPVVVVSLDWVFRVLSTAIAERVPSASAPSPHHAPRAFRPRAASADRRPGPVRASDAAMVDRTSGYS